MEVSKVIFLSVILRYVICACRSGNCGSRGYDSYDAYDNYDNYDSYNGYEDSNIYNNSYDGFDNYYPYNNYIEQRYPDKDRYYDRISMERYVDTVIHYLRKSYWSREELPFSEHDVRRTLRQSYEYLCKNTQGLVLFTAHVIFGTGGFLHLQGGWEKWAARGILQVQTEANYLTLSKVNNNYWYYEHPDRLASLNYYAVQFSIKFWLYLLEQYYGCYDYYTEVSFWGTLGILNPWEYRHPYTPEGREKIMNRYKVYLELCRSFCIEPVPYYKPCSSGYPKPYDSFCETGYPNNCY